MGTDCALTLPSHAQVRDVAKVMGILLGRPSHRHEYRNGSQSGWWAEVDGVMVKPSGVTGLADISIEGETICCPDGQNGRFFLYHFEWGNKGKRGTMPRCTPVNIAMCVGLADFFGGKVDFNDCDSIEVDYHVRVREALWPHKNTPSDDPGWHQFQQAILDVQPLAQEDIDQYTGAY